MEEFRAELAARGVTFNLFVNDQFQSAVRGGANTNGSGRNSASLDGFLTLDLGKLGILGESEALLHVQSNWGDGINLRTGSSFQVNDDADGDLGFHIAQLWFRKHFAKRKVSLTLGFLDFQTIADRNAYANSEDKQFMHQVLDNNPLVPLNIGLGANLDLRPTDWYTLTLGVGDAQSVLYKPGFSTAFHDENWWFGYMEHAFHVDFQSAGGLLPGNYRVGMVYDPRPRAVFGKKDPTFEGHDYGAYVSLDQKLLRESAADEQGLGAFARFAYRTQETNRFTQFWSGGLEYRGLIPGRNDDVTGIGWALVHGSDEFRRSRELSDDTESVYELYYALQVAKPLVVTFDLQYLDNPGAAGDYDSAIVAGLRARLSF